MSSNQGCVERSTTLRQHLFVFSLMLLFAILFSEMLKSNWGLIFKKDLYHHDESTHSVVAANLTRKIFPGMIRINSLVEEYQVVVRDGRRNGLWMEGPHWQHVPPLFAYVPLAFFKLDGQVTIEVKRLSYAFVILLTGLIFILTVYSFEKTIVGAVSATLAAVFWAYTPFTRALICGVSFGNADMVLAFTVVCSFSILCWYLSKPRLIRQNYSYLRLAFMGAVVSLPVLTKNVLGAIPPATFFVILLYEQRKVNLRLAVSFLSFSICLLLYYGSLYISSPQTFLCEIFLPFRHFYNYEGWARPWHIFVTNYLPENYLKNQYSLFIAGIALGIFVLITGGFKGKSRTILSLSIVWFLWNLLAVSVVKSKAPNFIYQTYLLSLFFGLYSVSLICWQSFALAPVRAKLEKVFVSRYAQSCSLCLLIVLAFFATGAYWGLIRNIEQTRSLEYNYESEREKFYQFGEFEQRNGANTKDLFVLDASEDDYWFRYYILFLTGAEARTLDEIMPMEINLDSLKRKYDRLHFVFDRSRAVPDILMPYKNMDSPNFAVVSLNLAGRDFDKLKEDLSTRVIQEVSSGSNVFDLYEVKNSYPFIKVVNSQLWRQLSEKYEKLLSDYKVEREINENVSLVDYYYRRLSPNKYKFYFLFKVNKAFEKSWIIYMRGFVREEDVSLLSEKGQRYGAESWWIEPGSPTFSWLAGEHIIVAKEIEAKPISYNMQMGFYRPNEEELVRLIDLGWVDLAAPSRPLQTDQPVYEPVLPVKPEGDN
jgi:hypothetical protein